MKTYEEIKAQYEYLRTQHERLLEEVAFGHAYEGGPDPAIARLQQARQRMDYCGDLIKITLQRPIPF